MIEEMKKLCKNEKIFEGIKPNNFPITNLSEVPGLSIFLFVCSYISHVFFYEKNFLGGKEMFAENFRRIFENT